MKTPNEILNGKLIKDGETGDGKRAFVVGIHFDSQVKPAVIIIDCDSKFSKQWIARIIKCVNACRGIENPKVTEAP